MNLEQKKKNRFQFLQKLYNVTNADSRYMVNMWEVGQELGFDRNETSQIVDYLTEESLIEPRALGGGISIMHWGIKEIEQAIEQPSEPTEHFLPINIINIGTMNNSSIQQSTVHSTISNTVSNNDIELLDSLIPLLKDIINRLDESQECVIELKIDIETLEVQKQSPKPKKAIITESLKSIRTILESVAANALTPVILGMFDKIL